MAPTISMNDMVLAGSLLYLSIDMQFQTAEFDSCYWPVNRWLLVSYFFIIAFRFSHIVGTMHAASGTGDFLLNWRHKDTLPRILLSLTWLFILPMFTAWTVVGTFWLYDSKRLSERCLPTGMSLTFIIIWQVLSYGWIIIHSTMGGIAWVLERRLRRTEADIRAVVDTDTLSRWGVQVGELSGYTDLANNSIAGLTPDQIKSLPEGRAGDLNLGEDYECSICLNHIEPDDSARKLCGCGHAFHRACIDLWLLRSSECPLCKQNVNALCRPCQVDVTPDAYGFVEEHWHV